MENQGRNLYRIKYKGSNEEPYHYKYYEALDQSTAESMFRWDFIHSHGDDSEKECVDIEVVKKDIRSIRFSPEDEV